MRGVLAEDGCTIGAAEDTRPSDVQERRRALTRRRSALSGTHRRFAAGVCGAGLQEFLEVSNPNQSLPVVDWADERLELAASDSLPQGWRADSEASTCLSAPDKLFYFHDDSLP